MIRNLCAMRQVMHDLNLAPEQLASLVHRRLGRVLCSAYQHVPHYRELMEGVGYNPLRHYQGPEDLAKLPVTTKRVLKDKGSASFVREGSNLSGCYTETTSGSSGVPIRAYRSSYERAVQIARWLRVLFLNGYTVRDRVMSLTSPGRLGEGRSLVQRFGLLRRRAVDYLAHTPEQMVDILLADKPDVLYGNRSHLDLMALELRHRGVQPTGLKLLFATGEVIHESTRRLYQQWFGSDLLEVYGTVEMGVMAYETLAHDGLHLCQDLTYFEFLDDAGDPVPPGQVGRVVVTDLTGTMMPFIRYDQGDLVVYDRNTSADGRVSPRLTSILGRDGEFAVLPDGTRRSLYDFSILVKRFEEILQFRVVQRTPAHFEVLVVAERHYFERICSDLRQHLEGAFPATVEFSIRRVERLEPDRSGKVRLLVSEVGHESGRE